MHVCVCMYVCIYISMYVCIILYIECVEGEVHLVNGATENEGTVELCLNNLWGLIADSGWSQSDAEVVCRQLGYSKISM